MSPTQELSSPQQTLAAQLSCNENTSLNSEINNMVEYEIKKFPLAHQNEESEEDHSCKNEETVKVIVSELQKLWKQVKHVDNYHLINYKRAWFEGPLADKYSALTGLVASPSVEKQNDASIITYFCVEREKVEFVTLQSWLEDRTSFCLSESQILHLICQLTTAVKIAAESGVQIKSDALSLADIQVVLNDNNYYYSLTSHYIPSSAFYPNLKLSVFHFETLLNSFTTTDSNVLQIELLEGESSLFKFLEHVISKVCNKQQHNNKHGEEKSIWQQVHDLPSCKSLLDKLQQIKEKFGNNGSKSSNGFIFNASPPTDHFVGREAELKSLLAVAMESPRNKLIVIHGSNGSGKSELVSQLCVKLMDTQGQSSSVDATMMMNIICLDAGSADKLTASLYTCVSQQRNKLSISTVDYIKQPRLLKDIFLELLVSFSENNLLVVFENTDILSVEMLDLIQTFKENSTMLSSSSQRHHQHLILVTKQLWTCCPLLEDSDCTTLSLAPLQPEESKAILRNCLKTNSPSNTNAEEDDCLNKLSSEILHNCPAALKIITEHLSSSTTTTTTSMISNLVQSIASFHLKFPPAEEGQVYNNDPICLAYKFSLWHLYQSLDSDELQKLLMEKLLYSLQFVDGDSGIYIDALLEIVGHLSPPHALQQNSENNRHLQQQQHQTVLLSHLSLLRRFSLIAITDKVVKLCGWMQSGIRESLKILPLKNDSCNSEVLLSAYYITLSSKSVEADCWKLMGHAANTWKICARGSSDIAKRFDMLPELIAKLAKSFKKLELISAFLKEVGDIFTTAFGSPYDIHVLKVKYLLTVDCLLPKGLVNETFLVFKSIQDHCRTEPRDYLMIKLKSLIELGKIHIVRQDYDKAISCFQHVQVYAAQKISILQLDSEPVVLCARLKHGHAHLQQGNFEEAKKIILQVVPLLERYQGVELDNVRMLILEGKFYLGVLLRKMGDLVNALMMQTKVLEERERLFGDKHPDTWASKVEMSLLYSSYDNHDKALLILRQLLEIQDEVLGAPSNRHSLATMSSIAEIETKLGNFDDALELYEAIDLIEQQVLPENDQMRISSQLNQADVLMSLGQYKEATDIYDLVYTLLSSGGATGQQSGNALCQNILGKREKAERSMEILGNYWLSLTPENVDDPSELAALAKKHDVACQLTENQDNQGALRFLREILDDCDDHLEETNRFHLNVKADLARVLGLVGKFNESFSVYKEIIPLMDATFGETDELTMLCKDTMGQVFLFSGNQFLKRQMSNLKWFLL